MTIFAVGNKIRSAYVNSDLGYGHGVLTVVKIEEVPEERQRYTMHHQLVWVESDDGQTFGPSTGFYYRLTEE